MRDRYLGILERGFMFTVKVGRITIREAESMQIRAFGSE